MCVLKLPIPIPTLFNLSWLTVHRSTIIKDNHDCFFVGVNDSFLVMMQSHGGGIDGRDSRAVGFHVECFDEGLECDGFEMSENWGVVDGQLGPFENGRC